MISCDLCGSDNPRFVLESPGLDGPLVQCTRCGLRYVGSRRKNLTFGSEPVEIITERVRQANIGFQHLRLEEEHRLALLNARWRLDLIRRFCSSGKLLEVGCARGDFLRVARESFEVCGVEPNPDLAQFASSAARIHSDVIERTPWSDFDVAASFHVIEHVDSPRRFIGAMAERVKPGGVVVIETPDIESVPFKLLKGRWRQFIPEHYYFFDPVTIGKLFAMHGLKVEETMRVGKYASLALVLNRLSRYFPWLPQSDRLSRLTFRMNPMDIMIVFGRKPKNGVG